jgi:hypothetical protein
MGVCGSGAGSERSRAAGSEGGAEGRLICCAMATRPTIFTKVKQRASKGPHKKRTRPEPRQYTAADLEEGGRSVQFGVNPSFGSGPTSSLVQSFAAEIGNHKSPNRELSSSPR